MQMMSAFRSSTRSTALKSIVPAAVSSSGSVMYSGIIIASVGTHDRGVAIVTSPAPERSAPSAARCAAPVRPTDPAMTRTRPKSPLCESAARAGTSSRMRSRVSSSSHGPSSSSITDAGNPDVGDHQIAAVGVGRRQDRAASSAPPA